MGLVVLQTWPDSPSAGVGGVPGEGAALSAEARGGGMAGVMGDGRGWSGGWGADSQEALRSPPQVSSWLVYRCLSVLCLFGRKVACRERDLKPNTST